MKPVLSLFISVLICYSRELTSQPDNPARMLQVEHPTISAVSHFTDKPSYALLDLSLLTPIGLYQTYTLEVKHRFEEPGLNSSSVMAGYAVNPWHGLSAGISTGYYTYKDSSVQNHTVPLNLGVTYRLPPGKPIWGVHTFGISARNLTAVPTDKDEILIQQRSVKGDWAADFFEGKVKLSGVLGTTVDTPSLLYTADISVRPSAFELGYTNTERYWNIYGGLNSQIAGNLSIGFAWGTYKNGLPFIRGIFEKGFGKKREQYYIRKMGECACNIPPEKLFIKACYSFEDKEYFVSAAILGRLSTEHPNFMKHNWVKTYIAMNFEKLDLRRSAKLVLLDISTKDSLNTPLHHENAVNTTKLQLSMKENDPAIEELFVEQLTKLIPDSIQSRNYSIMGEYYLRNGDYESAQYHFNGALNLNRESVTAQRGFSTAERLLETGGTYSLKDTVLIQKYHEIRDGYETSGLEYLSLILKQVSSHVISLQDAMIQKITPQYEIIMQYDTAWEQEKNRILQNNDIK